jgi:hypothetical protein
MLPWDPRPRQAGTRPRKGGTVFRLVSSGWDAEFIAARRAAPRRLRIVCPFIKLGAMERILKAGDPARIKVITRFDLNCFYERVSDLDALELLLDAGAKVRGRRGLHSKLFLLDRAIAIGTSANVTDAGMLRNHEFGFVSDEAEVVGASNRYFDELWAISGRNLRAGRIAEWRDTIRKARARHGGGGGRPRLKDHGASGGEDPGGGNPLDGRSGAPASGQAYLKFFGRGVDRTPRTERIADIVAESGCNWAATFPTGRRPRQIEDGDTIYMARIAQPDDLLIFGRATGYRHRDDEDVASAAEIAERGWKADWANYVRVDDARFIDANLGVGVSMRGMMQALGSDSFRSTQRNVASGVGNTDPFASYLRKPGMMLTDRSRRWIDARLEALFRRHGEVDLRPARFRPPA